MLAMPWWLIMIFLKYTNKAPTGSFDYGDTDRWASSYPLCGGPMQSPVELTATRTTISRTPKLRFARGLKDGEVEVTNTGREIKLKLLPKNRTEPLLELVSYSSPMNGAYTFAQMHFHWGPGAQHHGSEHCVNDQYTDTEAHFVFFNSRYGGFKEAVRHFDGLLVIGVMLRGAQQPGGLAFPTLGLENKLHAIDLPGNRLTRRTDLTYFKTLLQHAVGNFYSYHGSLTTPPCNPVVTWMVAAKPVDVSSTFLERLRTEIFEDADGTRPLVNNCRPTQGRSGRTITKHISIG
ncbi:carbonic anhydrase-like [Amphibalanus amphitrite]|uniref:carbonic anhydrase-like n=1 Tax=Amphibalanus amphitrite TaxID=1232801 RepID=UPI001C8FD658|nr:carbonic anhydrase-like [Amphibalanus amphitrite]